MPNFSGNHLATRSTMTAGVAMVLISCFGFAAIGLHFLRTDYDPLRRFISEYAVGPYSIIMRLGFFFLGTGSFALVVALYRSIPRSARSYTALILLLSWTFVYLSQEFSRPIWLVLPKLLREIFTTRLL